MELSQHQMQGMALLGIAALLLCFASYLFATSGMDYHSLLTKAKTLLESKTVRWGVYLAASALVRTAAVSMEDVDHMATQAGIILNAIWAIADLYAAKRVIANRANTQRVMVNGEWKEIGDIPFYSEVETDQEPREESALEKVIVQRIVGQTAYPEQDIPPPQRTKEEREADFQKWLASRKIND